MKGESGSALQWREADMARFEREEREGGKNAKKQSTNKLGKNIIQIFFQEKSLGELM